MKLRELLKSLGEVDSDEIPVMSDWLELPVVFDTSTRHDLVLLSVYEHEGTIRIDIGDPGE